MSATGLLPWPLPTLVGSTSVFAQKTTSTLVMNTGATGLDLGMCTDLPKEGHS